MSDLVHVRTLFTIPGPKVASFGHDYRYSTDVDEDNLDDIALAAFSAWGTGGTLVAQKFPTVTVCTGATAFAYDIVPNDDPTPGAPPFKKQLTLGPRAVSGNSPGGNAGAPVPPQVALVCTLRTPVSTRRTRGRVYLPPIIASQIASDGRYDSVQAAALEGLLETYFETVAAAGEAPETFAHVVVSLQEANRVTTVTDYVLKRRVDTQRRRLTRSLDTV